MPTFCEAHLIKHQIPNIIDTIEPDYIIYNEGMFPTGPENTTNVDDKFLNEYTLDGKRGFDFEELQEIIHEAQKKYKDTKIILNKMEYPEGMYDVMDCWYEASSNFDKLGIDVEVGDYIFPYESDVFHHEDSKEEIQSYLQQLKPNTGFRSIWIDFVENQFYAFKSTLKPFLKREWAEQGRSRRICIKFGDWDWYKQVLGGLMTQQYPMLYPTDLITYHYVWWRPEKYKKMRFAQLNRGDNFWETFESACENIKSLKYNEIRVYPGPKHLTSKWIKFHDIKHPKHIKKHENYLGYVAESVVNSLNNSLEVIDGVE